MTPAAAAILDGMPEPRDLHRVTTDGTTWILAGPVALFSYAEADAGMRNIAVVTLRQLGYGGQAVAELMGLSENYVATLRNRALRQGTAGVVRQPGARRKLGEAGWARARSWRESGTSEAEIARRLGVHQSAVLRRLGPRDAQDELPLAEPGPATCPEPEPARRPDPQSGPAPGTDLVPAGRPGAGTLAGTGTRLRPGRGSRGPASTRGMRARCCCTPSPDGRPRARSWPPRPGRSGGTGSGTATWRCWRRPASASPSAPPRWSSSST